MSPLYDYLCGDCGEAQEEFHKIDDRPADVECDSCGGKAQQSIVVTVPTVHRFAAGYNWVLDETFSSRRAHDTYCKEHNLERP